MTATGTFQSFFQMKMLKSSFKKAHILIGLTVHYFRGLDTEDPPKTNHAMPPFCGLLVIFCTVHVVQLKKRLEQNKMAKTFQLDSRLKLSDNKTAT